MLTFWIAQAESVEWSFDWANQTRLHPLGVLVCLLAGSAILLLPRAHAVVGIAVATCCVSTGQRLVVGGLDFTLLRLVVSFGLWRVILKGECNRRWSVLDWLVASWLTSATLVYSAQWLSPSAFINRAGVAFEIGGLYFIMRCLIREYADVRYAVRIFAMFCILSMPFFLLEWSTGRNMFSIFGGVSPVTAVREGRLRCQGPFSHPILAGVFWASFAPLFAAMWSDRANARLLCILSVAASSLLVLLSASSTPVFALGIAVIGGALVRVRRHLGIIRICAVLAVLGLHLIMNKPVWHLLARVSAVGGSTGWHRFTVIDSVITHFDEWALLGTRSISHWSVWNGDITNEYVLQGIRGGVLTLALFLAVLYFAFKSVGVLWRAVEKDSAAFAMVWALGVGLSAQAASFVGVSYFGQVWTVFAFQLAVIASLTERVVLGRVSVPRFGGVPRGAHWAMESKI